MRIRIISDGTTHEGENAADVVTSMKNASPMNRAMAIEEYMPRVRAWSGEASVQTDSPEAFVESLRLAGLITMLD